jgi:hypothetical protein
MPVKAWQVGLASAPELAGPWTRVAGLNPIAIDKRFVENPVVSRLDDGWYIAVYNSIKADSIGYTTSSDGIHWSQGANLAIEPRGLGHWGNPVRTPLGLIPEGNGTFTLFYTGFLRNGKGEPFSDRDPVPTAVGFVKVKVEYTAAN